MREVVGVQQDGEGAHRLLAEEAEAAAVEQAVDAVGCFGGGHDAHEQGAGDTADQVRL